MTVDLALDDGHDLTLSQGGDCRLVDGTERIAQQIKVTLLTSLGEWFLDSSFGVPYCEDVLVKNPDRNGLEAIFRARIAAVPGVLSVRSIALQIDRERRALALDFTAETAEGTVQRQYRLRG